MTLTPQAEAFVAEWRSPSPFVTAHTSGSTGSPKEIRLHKADMRASAHATLRHFGITSDSLLHLPLSPSYIAGKMHIVRAIEAGCSLITEPPSNHPLSTLPDGFASRIDLLPVVPSQIAGLLASPHLGLVGSLIIGGAPLSPADEAAVNAAGVNAYATYGMTETCSHVALRRLGHPSFTALPGFTFTTDSRGCLVITTGTMSFGRLVTNDIVDLLSDDSFIWRGRFDNVINSAGLKIHPEELERLIAPHIPQGTRFYVTSRQSRRWGQEAILVTDNPSVTKAILDTIEPILPPHTCPKDVLTDRQMALTSSQKIIRRRF